MTPDVLPESGISVDVSDMVELSLEGAPVEIKEWQAIMENLQALPIDYDEPCTAEGGGRFAAAIRERLFTQGNGHWLGERQVAHRITADSAADREREAVTA